MPWPAYANATTETTVHRGCGLGQADRLIWSRAIERGLIHPAYLWWCEPLGNVPAWVHEIPDPVRRNWCVQTWSKRPDVIYLEGDAYRIVEIKPYASYVALGQAIVYGALAAARNTSGKPTWPTILTDQPDPDIVAAANAHGVNIIELGEPLADRPTRPT